MRKTNVSALIAIVVLALFLSGTLFAQNAQDKYNNLLKEANEVRSQMGEQGITKEKYDELNTKYQNLQKQIKSVEQELMATSNFPSASTTPSGHSMMATQPIKKGNTN